MSRLFQPRYLKYLLAFSLPLAFVTFVNCSIDNDTWVYLAQGRHITEHGIYYTDPLSMHTGLAITVQNYAYSVVLWLIYSAFGLAGVYLMHFFAISAICFLLYKICMLLSSKNTNLSLLLMVITSLILSLQFFATRAQMFSYIIFLSFIYLLELYVSTKNTKYLRFLPLLSLIQVNFHASLWWMLFLVLLVYIIDSLDFRHLKCLQRFPTLGKIPLQGYHTRPLLIAATVSLLAGLLNPYGFKMISFIFTSYNADDAMMDAISELTPFSVRATTEKILYLCIVVVLIVYILAKNRRLRVRYLLMFFGFFALALNSFKASSQFILTLFFPLALVFKDAQLPPRKLPPRLAIQALSWCAILSLCFAIGGAITASYQIATHTPPRLAAVVDAIDTDLASSTSNASSTSAFPIYTRFEDGGYLEFRGYHPYIDTRAEAFLTVNNGQFNYFREWWQLENSELSPSDFLAKYHFAYLVVHEGQALYSLDSSLPYTLLFEDTAITSHRIRVYKTTEES